MLQDIFVCYCTFCFLISFIPVHFVPICVIRSPSHRKAGRVCTTDMFRTSFVIIYTRCHNPPICLTHIIIHSMSRSTPLLTLSSVPPATRSGSVALSISVPAWLSRAQRSHLSPPIILRYCTHTPDILSRPQTLLWNSRLLADVLHHQHFAVLRSCAGLLLFSNPVSSFFQRLYSGFLPWLPQYSYSQNKSFWTCLRFSSFANSHTCTTLTQFVPCITVSP